MKMMENKRRLYVLIDKSLNPIYGCVQGAHCVVNFRNEYPSEWNNEYLIFLYADVERYKEKLINRNIDFSEFFEPDLDNKLTAIACEGNERLFKNLKLVS